ncbi:MAG: hypothetical protein EPO32_11440 [Anaerolineae bacterium]|nr:MAG: hypothetical protein EPO32_11440 [Anaerolineae bacterium]
MSIQRQPAFFAQDVGHGEELTAHESLPVIFDELLLYVSIALEVLGFQPLIAQGVVPNFLANAEKEGIVPRMEQVEDFASRARVPLLR